MRCLRDFLVTALDLGPATLDGLPREILWRPQFFNPLPIRFRLGAVIAPFDPRSIGPDLGRRLLLLV